MHISSACHNKSKMKSLEFSTSLTTFIPFSDLNTKFSCPPDLKNSLEGLKIGISLNLSLNLPWVSSAKSTKSMKEMVLSMVQKSTLSYLILLEDNTNVVLANLTSNFRSDSTFNTEQRKLSNKRMSKKKTNKNKRNKKSS